MATQLHPAKVSAALVAILKQTLDGVTVREASPSDFDANGFLTAPPPAALVIFNGAMFEGGNLLANIYDTTQSWAVMFGARNLRGGDSQRADAQSLVQEGCNALAGARLDLADGKTNPIELLSIDPPQINDQGTWYQLNFAVSAPAQYGAEEA